MTRKDYEQLAFWIRLFRAGNERDDATERSRMFEETVAVIAAELSADNPRFDRRRFIAATQ